MKIKSRKELKGLLDWYDELLNNHKRFTRREIITKIYQNYKSTTFNEEKNGN
jgi:hypothetical protein